MHVVHELLLSGRSRIHIHAWPETSALERSRCVAECRDKFCFGKAPNTYSVSLACSVWSKLLAKLEGGLRDRLSRLCLGCFAELLISPTVHNSAETWLFFTEE